MRKLFAKRAGTAGGHRPIIVAVVGVAALLAAGCSALRFGYGQAPTLGYHWADKYFDFDGQQSPRVRAALAQWFAWHRSTQLPDYAQLLARAQAEVQRPVAVEQVCQWVDTLQDRADVAYAQAVPAMARLAPDVKPGQIRHMARRFDKINEEFRDDVLEEPLPEQHRITAKQVRERYEMLFGALERPQLAALEAVVAHAPISPAQWDAERRHRQQDTLATLRRIVDERIGPEAAQAALMSLYERAKHSPRPAYLALQQQARQSHCALFAQLHALSTPSQRQEMTRKLRGWEEDARLLAGEGQAPKAAAATTDAWVPGRSATALALLMGAD